MASRNLLRSVNEQIPEPFRKLVFQMSRGGDGAHAVEKLATAVYYRLATIPCDHAIYRTTDEDSVDLNE